MLKKGTKRHKFGHKKYFQVSNNEHEKVYLYTFHARGVSPSKCIYIYARSLIPHGEKNPDFYIKSVTNSKLFFQTYTVTNPKRQLTMSDSFRESRCRDENNCICGREIGGRCRSEVATDEMRCEGCDGRSLGEESRGVLCIYAKRWSTGLIC